MPAVVQRGGVIGPKIWQKKMSPLSNTFDLWKRVRICCSFNKLASKHWLTFMSSSKINVRHVKIKELANISLKYKKTNVSLFLYSYIYSAFIAACLLFSFEESF